jgi:hypothetical protein
MDTITITTLLLSTLGILGCAFVWKLLLVFLAGQFCFWIAKHYSEKAAEQFAKFLDWLNRKILSLSSAVIKKMVEIFKSFVQGMKATYEKKNANTVECTRETRINIGNNQTETIIETTTIPWDEVPKEIRNKMVKKQTSQSVMDEKQFVLDLTKKRAEEENLPEIMELIV